MNGINCLLNNLVVNRSNMKFAKSESCFGNFESRPYHVKILILDTWFLIIPKKVTFFKILSSNIILLKTTDDIKNLFAVMGC